MFEGMENTEEYNLLNLENVDVEVDGWVESGEGVGEASDIFDPSRPGYLLLNMRPINFKSSLYEHVMIISYISPE